MNKVTKSFLIVGLFLMTFMTFASYQQQMLLERPIEEKKSKLIASVNIVNVSFTKQKSDKSQVLQSLETMHLLAAAPACPAAPKLPNSSEEPILPFKPMSGLVQQIETSNNMQCTTRQRLFPDLLCCFRFLRLFN